MKYRADINGLRAIAVLPIVFYHAGISSMSGGFIGVDIFFVISGYLISKIIIDELDNNNFKLIEFYKRRTIRIFPALLFMLSALLIVSYFLALPTELASLKNSINAAALSVSNIYFWFETDYFSPLAETQPLLHTWSLGVEEQFYLLFPLLLLLIKKYFNKNYAPFLLVIIVLSLVLSWYASISHADAGFYLLHSRAWELALGSLVAIKFFPKVNSVTLANSLVLLGLFCILIGFFYIEPRWRFPFPWAMLPCLGTFLLLSYGEVAQLSKLLSLQPLQYVGKISYSLYLWHWPIITLYRIETGIELDLNETVFLVALSFIAATFSYYIIEKNFLIKFRSNQSPKRVVMVGVLSLFVFCLVTSFLINNIDYLKTTDKYISKIDSYNNYKKTPNYKFQYRVGSPCFRGMAHRHISFSPEMCAKTIGNSRNVIILGDSHAAQFWRAFEIQYPQANVMQATASGCRPVLDSKGTSYCTEVVDYVLGPMLDNQGFDTIIISARWVRREIPLLAKTVSFLKQRGIRVYVLGNTVEYNGSFPSILARAIKRGELESIDSHRIHSKEVMDKYIEAATIKNGGEFISLFNSECQSGQCKLTTDEGVPLHFDYGHLTLSGAKWHVSKMPKIY
ncbi:MAG: acyltransferase family protein [Aliiglaciecola sp.]|uniref:acyltransferase family protein n=1 Tax=Aliiglaciecola sp. TaxID=1872441 RepID=UPI003299AE9D